MNYFLKVGVAIGISHISYPIRFGITIRGGIKHNHITSHILDLNVLLMDLEVHSFS